jgi:hypothetical protein
MVRDISLEQAPSDLDELLSDLDAGQGNVGARALSAALSLHGRAIDGGAVSTEAQRMRRIAECCEVLSNQLDADPT